MYKKVNVVMLPTNEKAKHGDYCKPYDKHIMFNRGEYNAPKLEWYITSDEEIKEGDWYYHSNDIGIYNQLNAVDNFCKKIIATTDTSLSIIIKLSLREGSIIHSCDRHDNLPQPTQQFIQQYIEEYNKGNVITKVEVEYEDSHTSQAPYPYLKVNPDNTINIKSIKESWSKEEVIMIVYKAMNVLIDNHHLHYDYYNDQLREWIKQNL